VRRVLVPIDRIILHSNQEIITRLEENSAKTQSLLSFSCGGQIAAQQARDARITQQKGGGNCAIDPKCVVTFLLLTLY
jgi:hypothetical protein